MAFNMINNTMPTVSFSMAPASLPHAIEYLTKPLSSIVPPRHIALLKRTLRTELERAYLLSRPAAVRLSFAPNALPPTPILAVLSTSAGGVPWPVWRDALNCTQPWDLVIEPRMVVVESLHYLGVKPVVKREFVWADFSSVPPRFCAQEAIMRPVPAREASPSPAPESQVPISKTAQLSINAVNGPTYETLLATLNSARERAETRTLTQELMESDGQSGADEIIAPAPRRVLCATPRRAGFPATIAHPTVPALAQTFPVTPSSSIFASGYSYRSSASSPGSVLALPSLPAFHLSIPTSRFAAPASAPSPSPASSDSNSNSISISPAHSRPSSRASSLASEYPFTDSSDAGSSETSDSSIASIDTFGLKWKVAGKASLGAPLPVLPRARLFAQPQVYEEPQVYSDSDVEAEVERQMKYEMTTSPFTGKPVFSRPPHSFSASASTYSTSSASSTSTSDVEDVEDAGEGDGDGEGKIIIDQSKKSPQKYLYQGGVSTVLTGGVMLGAASSKPSSSSKPSPSPRAPKSTPAKTSTSTAGWRSTAGKTPATSAKASTKSSVAAEKEKEKEKEKVQSTKYRAPIGTGRWDVPVAAGSWRRN